MKFKSGENPLDEDQRMIERKRLARIEVRKAIRQQKNKLAELRKGISNGQDLSDDMDSCKGEIELLMKELKSIEEGGHTTFLNAKNLISPKKEISSKKKTIKDSINEIQIQIKELEHKLYEPKLEQHVRDKLIKTISEKNAAKLDFEEELQAVRQYNHTRFLEAREENRKSNELERKLEDIEDQKKNLKRDILEAMDKNQRSIVKELKNKLDDLDVQKYELINSEFQSQEENPKDPFLEE